MQKVSVIIPVYNVEKYLSQNLDSLINQTYENLEIICINDCSQDNSIRILEQYAQKDHRIKVINNDKSKGLSASRNIGLDNANGEYIYFLDSDDWIENNYIESMVNALEENCADIVYNRNIKLDYNDYIEEYNPSNIEITLKDNTFVDIPENAHGIFCTIWSKLYKKDFIQKYNLKFPVGYEHEDVFYHYASLGCAKNLYIFRGAAYHYRKRQNSITDILSSQRIYSVKFFELIYDFYKENNLLNKNIKIFYVTPAFYINDENMYNEFKSYFKKAGEYILSSGIFNDLECFLCNNILNTKDFEDYHKKYHANVAISFIRNNKK